MSESGDVVPSVVSRAETFGKEVEGVFGSPAFEEQVSLELLNIFCQYNDSVRFTASGDDEVTYEAGEGGELEFKVREHPTMADMVKVIQVLRDELKEDFLPSETKMQEVGKTFCGISAWIYAKADGCVSEEDLKAYRDMAIQLYTHGMRLEGTAEISNEQVLVELESRKNEANMDDEMLLWLILGERSSEAYTRLFTRFLKSSRNFAETKQRREEEAIQLEEALVTGNGNLIERAREKLVETIMGATTVDFEQYLLAKRDFLEDVAFNYMGGMRSVTGIREWTKRAVSFSLQQAIWERGMSANLLTLKADGEGYRWAKKSLGCLHELYELEAIDEDERGNQEAQIALKLEEENLLKALDLPDREKELFEMRKRMHDGEITLEELAEAERSWLEELHGQFGIPYDIDFVEYAGPAEMKKIDEFTCGYQAYFHGFVLMRYFPTYSVTFCGDEHDEIGRVIGHGAVLVQTSDQNFTLFDNSGWDLEHVSPDLLNPKMVDSLVNERSTRGTYRDERRNVIFGQHKMRVKSMDYFAEEVLESIWNQASLGKIRLGLKRHMDQLRVNPESVLRGSIGPGVPFFASTPRGMNLKSLEQVTQFYGEGLTPYERNTALEYILSGRRDRLNDPVFLEIALSLVGKIPDSRSAYYVGNALCDVGARASFDSTKQGLSILSGMNDFGYYQYVLGHVHEKLNAHYAAAKDWELVIPEKLNELMRKKKYVEELVEILRQGDSEA